MRRLILTFFFALLGLIVVSQQSQAIYSQQTSNNQTKAFALPKSGVLGNPDRLFDLLSQGKPTLTISEAGSLRGMLRRFANDQELGDEITRQQFFVFCQALTAKVAFSGIASEPRLTNAWEMTAVLEFRRRDANMDFLLNRDEVENRLRDSFFTWDRNRDDLIELDEYAAFYAWKMVDRVQTIGQRLRQPPEIADAKSQKDDDWENRPPVFRHGTLPDGLPDWFDHADADNDGQVGLYEWRDTTFPLEEFFAADLNGDSLLTAEEVLRHIAQIEQSDTSNNGSNQGSSGKQKKKSNIWKRGVKKSAG